MTVPQPEFDNVEDIAAFWAVRLSDPECTPEDRYAFEAWKQKDPAHGEVFDRLQRGNAFVDRHLADPEIQAMVEAARAETRPPVWRQRGVRQLALAASVVVAVGAAVLLSLNGGLLPSAGPSDTVAVQYQTAIGERSTLTLSDGSVVTLNTNSRIDVDFSAEERFIRLGHGQAFFEVAKDIDRPFVVAAGNKRIVALGTAFDVWLDNDNGVQVTLVEGRVQVDAVPSVSPSRTAGPAVSPVEPIKLEPGERLVAKANFAPAVENTNADEATSWRRGQLIFRDRPLADVVEEMNRYSTQQIVLDPDDSRVLEMQVSGVFNTGRASSFVTALETMHPLKAKRSGQNELTLMWQE